ncbi:hypothetical protein AVEN_104135-1 [Araneus ventricosus]|uniref:Uncharacterized protein n=1 Tax=Araneus ventricosus TaxID=182803 RepID=A0A4Y2I7Y2_ARAVE|nr:hypothetical protein AVEN_104135-1 [Araneus ventricosus]
MMGKDDLVPYRTYLRGNLRISPPLKRSQQLETDFVDVRRNVAPDRLPQYESSKHYIPALPRLAYSPDVAPCDFFLG